MPVIGGDLGFVTLQGGKHDGKRVSDPDIAIHEDDTIHVGSDFYIVGRDGIGVPVAPRARRAGRTFTVAVEDLLKAKR